jgi:chromosome partitioning protein
VVRITACTNQKGGVGKTTTVVNLAAYLALSGTRTLVVDLDPQGNATSGLGVDRRSLDRSVYDALIDRAPVDELVVDTPVPGLRLLPSAQALSGAEVELVGVPARERRLAASLAELDDAYDRVLIDCPPSLGLLTVNALVAATHILIPIQSSYFALEGTDDLLETIEKVRLRPNPALKLLGVVITMHDKRTALARDIRAQIQKVFGGKVFNTVITKSVRLEESPAYKESIFTFAPDSTGASEYYRLCEEVIDRV